ncbi:MAG: magnesium/cobalt transporter CorA [Desulfosarcinaceae bacterium]
MARFIKKSFSKAGSAPGTLVHNGEGKTEKPRLTLMAYSPQALDERQFQGLDQLPEPGDPDTAAWVDIDGVHDLGLIEQIGARFGIHPLTQEDIVNTGQRPKVEDFEDYLFLVFKMLRYDETEEIIISEQVSLVLGATWLISFQETPGDVFDPVRERLRKAKGRIRAAGCDYLAYALLDAVVDHYFHILERIGSRIEALEETITDTPQQKNLHAIHYLKREVIYLRKQIWPLREMINRLTKGDNPLIREATHIYLGDVYDHVIQCLDTIDSYRDLLTSTLDLYLSMVSNRMNEVMKVLTIIATIFIPITFVAGIYGMNFKDMPELSWRWGYAFAWAIILAIAVGMLIYFKRKKWL